jgi:fructan beta-fructosidase
MPKPPLYAEALRPQFHFTARRNWLNDPNGMVYHEGQYHLFFQHNPKGIDWGHMTWGHAVSQDMVHWKQLPHAIHPDERGAIFSGSAVIDTDNTARFQTGRRPPLVALFTYATKGPGTQALAYSNDGGRTFTKYAHNPVLPNITGQTDRDPKVFRHEKTGRWVMVLYLDRGHTFAFFTSTDLKQWKKVSTIKGFFECPDFFELPVDGNPRRKRWVLHGAAGKCLVGRFDGKRFTPDHDGQVPLNVGRNFYAAQSFNHMPDGRRVQIAWMRGGSFAGMPFNQQMTFPYELTLRTTPEGTRVCSWPVAEIEQLYIGRTTLRNRVLKDGSVNPLAAIEGDLFDIEAQVKLGSAKEVGFVLRGQVYSYDVRKQMFCGRKHAPLPPEKWRLHVRFLVDRASIEMFAGRGLISAADSVVFSPHQDGLGVYARGGRAVLETMTIRKLRSVW